MSADACTSLVDVAYLFSQLPLSRDRNDRPVQALLMLLDAAVAVASAIDDNILEDLQALPVDDQNRIKSRLDKIAEKTAGAARTQRLPVDLAALHDPDFSDGLSSIEHLNRLSGVAPASAQPAAIAQPAEGPGPVALGRSGLTPEEIEASFRDWWKDRHGSPYIGAAPLAPFIEWTQFALARHGCPPLQEPDHASLIAFAHGLEPWATWLKRGGCLESAHCELGDLMMAVLARHARPTFQPIPVSERLPGPEDCCRRPPWPGKWCWGWVQPGEMDPDDPAPYSGCWRMMRWEWLSAEALAWAPWWALPMPGSHLPGATEMVREEQP